MTFLPWQQHRVLQQHVLLLFLMLLRALQQYEEVVAHGKPSPTESLVEQDCVSSRYWLCVSWAESSCPTESRREKTTKKQQLTL